MDKLLREAFWSATSLSTLRSSATEDGLALSNGFGRTKAGASSAHSKRFARFGGGLGGLCARMAGADSR